MKNREWEKNRRLALSLVGVTLGCVLTGCLSDLRHSDNQSDGPVISDFVSPPKEARPRVWWHWMNGNITEQGISRDLEWMHRVGIGGVQNFDAAMETPIVTDQRLTYMSPAWKQAFAFAVNKADSLGLEFAIASSAGWSLTGGPWVKPEDGMKKLVWSETRVAGGKVLDIALPEPSGVVGPYQSLLASYKHGHNEDAIPDSFYRDSVVLAYPERDSEQEVLPHTVTANGHAVEAASLFDGDLATGIALPGQNGKTPGIIEIVYSQPVSMQSAVAYIANLPADFMRGPLKPTLQSWSEEKSWHDIVQIELGAVPATVSFLPITSSKFRLVFTRDKPSGFFHFSPAPGLDPSGIGNLGVASDNEPLLTDFRLAGAPRIHAFEVKAGYRLVEDYSKLGAFADDGLKGVDPATVVNLTELMTANGKLVWSAPPGNWKILRLGYSLTGKTNSPATDEATGLEVDKYDSAAVERYLDTYLGMYESVVGEDLIGERGLDALLTDSTEAGPSNWTPQMVEHFKRLRGYDPTSWLPALTGEIVGSRASSDKFLYDFRRTLGQLSASEHYGTVARVAHEHGLTVYGESLEGNRLVSTLGDDLEMRRFADIPMAAMWTYGKGRTPSSHYVADMRGASSVAHLYGKRFVAAESLTSILSPWAHAPADLQPMVDAEFLSGINRPVIHTSVHQPVDDKVPGLSLHVFGQFFTRHETWAEMAKPWIDYLSRNSYMLQQGVNVADVAYFYGEEPPIGVLAGTDEGYPQDVPTRYAYDFIPPDAVLNELSVDEGDVVTRGGARYKVLYLGGTSRDFMTLPVLKRMSELVEQGATLVGLAPNASPSLGDDKQAFEALVAKLWSHEDITRVGSGRVFAKADIEAVLIEIGLAADFDAVAAHPVQFVHRRMADGDLYFVANRGEALQIDGRFRTTDKAPEIWRADTGAVEPASYRFEEGKTVVPLNMGAWESLYVVFRSPTKEPSRLIRQPTLTAQATINGPWDVSFQKARGAPEKAVFETLQSLSKHEDPGIRYFSGVATYRNQIALPGDSMTQPLKLDLGQVGDVAEVYVNGKYAGTAWKPPYRVDVAKHVQSGSNSIEIRVANLWVNRLIGDRQPGMKPVTYTTFKTYLPNAPLRASGLIGPVTLLTGE